MRAITHRKWRLGLGGLVGAFMVFPIAGSAEDESEAIADAQVLVLISCTATKLETWSIFTFVWVSRDAHRKTEVIYHA
jgi:hypothetical protein